MIRLLCFFILCTSMPSLAQHTEDSTSTTPSTWTVIHAGQLLSIPGETPDSLQSIIIHDGHIVRVENGFVDPSSLNQEHVELIDLSDQFVLPGLIDAHDHITAKPGRVKRIWDTTASDSLRALYGAHYAKLTLEAGFTTIRNIGSVGESIYALRDAVNLNLIPGPRIQASGNYLSVTGGHGDRATGFRWDLIEPLEHDGICDGADECRKAVRKLIRKGSDWIKVMATGGVNSEAQTGIGQHFTDAELSAIVETAHSLGRKVAAHAHAASGVNAALRAGVDSIEHGAFLDDESIRLLKQTNTPLVATLSVGDHVLQIANDPNSGMSEGVRVKAREAIPTMLDNVAKAYRAGVTIVFGTDSGEPEHGRNADEFLFLVQIGMSEMDAIKSATIHAAELMGIQTQVGTIEAGKLADIVATRSNPLDDISALQNISFVMREGQVYKKSN